jgi:hypothetical protein
MPDTVRTSEINLDLIRPDQVKVQWYAFVKMIPYFLSVHTSEVDYTSQRGTVELCMLIDLERVDNFNLTIFVKEKKTTIVEGGWKLKCIFCFVETTHEPLHLDKLGLVQ